MPATTDDTRAIVRELSAEYARLDQQASQAYARFEEARNAVRAEPTNQAALTAAEERSRELDTIREQAAAVERRRNVELTGLTGEPAGQSARGDLEMTVQDTLLASLRADAAARALGSTDYKALRQRGAFDVTGRKSVEGILIPREATSFDEDGVPQNLSREALFNAIRSGDALGGIDRKATLVTGAAGTSAGMLVEPQRLNEGGILVPLRTRPLRLVDLITVGRTDSDEVSYVEWTAFTNAAAETAEATAATGTSGTKPESAIDFAARSTTVRTIAHWIPATKRALSDAGQLRTLIDQILRLGLDLRLDTQLATGNGTGENIRGIYNTPGIGAVTRVLAATGNTNTPETIADVIHRAITTVRLAFFEPNAVGIHPSDFERLRLLRETAAVANTAGTAGSYGGGAYIICDPLAGDAGVTIWGLRPVVSAAFTQGLPVVGDWTQMVMWLREGTQVLASDSHNDFFVRNLVAILAEFRAAVGVLAPAAFATASL